MFKIIYNIMQDLFQSIGDLKWSGWYRGAKCITVDGVRQQGDSSATMTLSNDDRLRITNASGRYEVALNGRLIYTNVILDADWLYEIYKWQLLKKGWKVD